MQGRIQKKGRREGKGGEVEEGQGQRGGKGEGKRGREKQ